MDNDYTDSQKLVLLYIRLASGVPVEPAQFAAEMGINRQTVYRQLSRLSQCRVPVYSVGRGQWTLLEGSPTPPPRKTVVPELYAFLQKEEA